MSIVKKVFAVGLLMLLIGALSGCDLINQKKQIDGLQAQVQGLQNSNKTLQTQKENLTVTEQPIESSLQNVEGKTAPQFKTIDGVIKFPNKLTIQDAVEDINNSFIRVGSKFQFTPSDNWLVKMRGSEMDLVHPSLIWGSIKAIAVGDDSVQEQDMQNIVKRFFNGFPATNITYRKVFMDDRVVGMIAKATITVDNKPNVVNVGFIVRGENGVLLLFNYQDNKSGVQQELIDLLISSGKYGDYSVKLE